VSAILGREVWYCDWKWVKRVKGRKVEEVVVIGFGLEQMDCKLERRRRVAVDMQCWKGGNGYWVKRKFEAQEQVQMRDVIRYFSFGSRLK